MRRPVLPTLAFAAFVLAGHSLRAQQPAACPWLTLGTASHLLGLSAVADVQLAQDGTGVCRFAPASQGPVGAAAAPLSPTLVLVVASNPQPSCGSHAKSLSGIGNQAQECAAQLTGADARISIAGKVRGQWFRLDGSHLPLASVRNPAPRWPDDSTRPTPLEVAAEQVADNLY
jgi:hypothetical protein